jgi:hypothetical protein
MLRSCKRSRTRSVVAYPDNWGADSDEASFLRSLLDGYLSSLVNARDEFRSKDP